MSTIQTDSGAKLKPLGRFHLLNGVEGCVVRVVEGYFMLKLSNLKSIYANILVPHIFSFPNLLLV